MEIGILLVVHLLSALVWVGGMFFAYVVLRPSMGAVLNPRTAKLWSAFFNDSQMGLARRCPTSCEWVRNDLSVWGNGLRRFVRPHYESVGLVMMALFGHLYFAPFRRFKWLWRRAIQGGAKHLNSIRRIVAMNLTLGMITIIGSGGRYFS